mmetsp:Transcript_23135/g.50311  ORF Transcript_23135/g.50311 Transcript_23135/m.50311 type:complete len:82 (+) Transcript_23135:183-428(+)
MSSLRAGSIFRQPRMAGGSSANSLVSVDPFARMLLRDLRCENSFGHWLHLSQLSRSRAPQSLLQVHTSNSRNERARGAPRE